MRNIKETTRGRSFAALTKKYENKWVALSADYKKVLAAGSSLDAVLKGVKQQEKVIVKILPQAGYVPVSLK
ncbi:MAG: hypothetical protein V1696_00445 [Candidatus Jorgensenbacteria bacterium]